MLTLTQAQTIVTQGLAKAREMKLKPMGIAVLDARGALKTYAAEDGTSLGRQYVAIGKASGSLGMGMGSRTLAKRGKEQPQFTIAVGEVMPGGLIPVPGGVLIKDASGELLGAVGVSGDISDKDEEVALAGIAAAGLVGDPGAD